MAEEFPLQVTLKAVDKATAPLRAFNVKLMQMTKPFKDSSTFRTLQSLGKNLAPVGKAIGDVGSSIKGVVSETGALAAKLAGIGVASGIAFYSLIRSSQAAGAALNDHSQRVGMTVDLYASLQFAMRRGGVGADEFASAMDTLNKNLGAARVGKGGGALLGLLNQVSPALAKQVKGAKSSEEAMALLTDAMQRIENPAKRAVLAQAAFGKGGTQMGEALHKGSAEIQRLQVEYGRLVGSQEEFAKHSAELGDALDNAETALSGLRNTLAAQFMPVFAELTKMFTEFMVEHRDELQTWAKETAAAIKDWVAGGGLQRLGEGLKSIGSAISSVVKFLGPMGTAFAGVTVLALPLVASLVSLGGSLVSLAVTAFPLVITAISTVAPLLASFGAAVWTAAAPILPFVAAAGALAYLGKTIYDNWDELAFIFRDWGNSLRWAVLDTWEQVKPILEALSKAMNGTFAGKALKIGLDAGNSVADKLTPGAVQAAAAPATSASVSTEATVKVDFSNLPKGARVTEAPGSTAPLDLSLGYAVAP